MNKKQFIRNHQFLFIGGILGELLSLPGGGSYFKTCMRVIENRYENPLCFRYMPPTPNKSSLNAKKIKEKVEDLYRANQKPVIIISHSKGCQECLYLALSAPELFDQKLKGVTFVQGSFLGSSLIEILLGEKRELSSFYKVTGSILKLIPAIQDLRLNAMSREFKNLSQSLSDLERSQLEAKMLNIKSVFKKGQKLAWILKLGHFYYSQYFKVESDGLVSYDQQTLPFLTVKTIEFTGDHSHLFTSWPIASSNLSDREAKTEKLLEAIYKQFSSDQAI